MTAKLLIRVDENGQILTWGEEFDGGIEVKDVPADWGTNSMSKYIWNGTALVVRAGWVDPEPEA